MLLNLLQNNIKLINYYLENKITVDDNISYTMKISIRILSAIIKPRINLDIQKYITCYKL